MSEYENRYDDQEDDTNYAPYVVAGVGGAGGRLLARKLAGKGARVKIKGKGKVAGKTSRQLRADRLANIGTGAGAASGYVVGSAATEPESVRDTLNRVLEARDAVAGAGSALTSQTSQQIASDLLRAGGAVALAGSTVPIYRFLKRQVRELKSSAKKGKNKASLAPDIKDAKTFGKRFATGVGAASAGLAIKPEQRQPYSVGNPLPSPVFQDTYDPYQSRRR
jgi:hypothetical protein